MASKAAVLGKTTKTDLPDALFAEPFDALDECAQMSGVDFL